MKHNLKPSIALKSVILTVLLVLFSVCITGAYIVTRAATEVRSHIDVRTAEMLERAGSEIELFLDTSVNRLVTLHEHIQFLTNDYLIETFLENTVLTQSQFSGFRLLDARNNIIATTNFIDQSRIADISKVDFYDVTENFQSSDVLFTPDGMPYVLVKSLSADDTSLVGCLNIHYLGEFVDELSVGNTGFVSIRSHIGNIIAHPDRALVYRQELLPDVNVITYDTDGVTLDSATDSDGKHYLRAYRSLAPYEWNITFLQQFEEAYLPVRSVVRSSVAAAAVTVVLAAVVGLIFGWLTTKPLRRLTEIVESFEIDARESSFEAFGSSEVYKLSVAFNDLVDRLHSRNLQLQESEIELSTVTNNVSELIFAIDKNGITKFVNDRFVEITGYSRNEYLGRRFVDLFDADGRRTFNDKLAGLLVSEPGASETFSLNLVPRDGNPRLLELSIVRRSISERSVLGTARDVTDRYQLQQQMLQSDKLATLGEIISSVAHELNNPLTAIIGYTDLLATSNDLPTDQAEFARVIHREAQRTSRIVQNLLDVARTHEPERAFCNLNDILDEVVEMRAYELSVRQIDIDKQLDTKIPPILADKHQIHQVVLNLVNNAVDALEGIRFNRRIVLKTSYDDRYAYLTVKDNGPGVETNISDKIFEPFVTSKPEGSGTGLGLSVSQRIINDHEGRLELRSPSDGGAEFAIILPFSKGTFNVMQPDAPEIVIEPMSILIIDDEQDIRAFLARKLESMGCEVAICADGEAAQKELQNGTYDEIICDLRMPGMDGWQLLRYIRAQHPEYVKRFICVTGDTLNNTMREQIEQIDVPILEKPFGFDDVLSLLSERQASRNNGTGSPGKKAEYST